MQYNQKILRKSLDNLILNIQFKFQVNRLKFVGVMCLADLKIAVLR